MTRRTVLTLCLSLIVTTVLAEVQVRLTYQGFPYKRTACEIPVYASGSVITLPAAQPKNAEGLNLIGWAYDGETYSPGSSFTVPETDVEFIPVWDEPGQGIETLSRQPSAVRKEIRDGHLMIVYGEKTFNAQGAEVK